MLDRIARRVIDPPLNRLGRGLAGAGVSANAVTFFGLALGLAAAVLVAREAYGAALVLLLLSRLADGLDGIDGPRTVCLTLELRKGQRISRLPRARPECQ